MLSLGILISLLGPFRTSLSSLFLVPRAPFAPWKGGIELSLFLAKKLMLVFSALLHSQAEQHTFVLISVCFCFLLVLFLQIMSPQLYCKFSSFLK